MARTEPKDRYNPLRKSYPRSRKVNAVSFEAETMFTRLIALCDDQAVYPASPHELVAGLYRERWEAGDVDVTTAARVRDELVLVDLVRMWTAEDGRQYLWIVNPLIKLRSDVNPDNRYPAPPAELLERGPHTGRQRDDDGPESAHIPDHTIPDPYPQKPARAREDSEPTEPQVGGAGPPPSLPKTSQPAACIAFAGVYRQAFPAANPARGTRLPPKWEEWAEGQTAGFLESITAEQLTKAYRWAGGSGKHGYWGPNRLEQWLELPQQRQPAGEAKATPDPTALFYKLPLSARQPYLDRAKSEYPTTPHSVQYQKAVGYWWKEQQAERTE